MDITDEIEKIMGRKITGIDCICMMGSSKEQMLEYARRRKREETNLRMTDSK